MHGQTRTSDHGEYNLNEEARPIGRASLILIVLTGLSDFS